MVGVTLYFLYNDYAQCLLGDEFFLIIISISPSVLQLLSGTYIGPENIGWINRLLVFKYWGQLPKMNLCIFVNDKHRWNQKGAHQARGPLGPVYFNIKKNGHCQFFLVSRVSLPLELGLDPPMTKSQFNWNTSRQVH